MNKRVLSIIATLLVAVFVILWQAGLLNSGKTKPKPGLTEAPKIDKEGELTFFKADGSPVKKIEIEIADTEAERQAGLMNVPWMEETQGMLFIFPVEERQAFWMKNTIIPLDIIYVNANMEIVSVAKNAQPFSERSLPSGRPAKYVIEVIAGFTDKFGLTNGDKCEWSAL
ncbi:MAG: DUF192 domain-containing protein [Chitinophagales bacterium]|nr:DUF192 domain-containing protein [Chitinophagales bacterium]